MIRFSSAHPDDLSVAPEPRKGREKAHAVGDRRSAMKRELQKKSIKKKLSSAFSRRNLMRLGGRMMSLKGLKPGTKSNDNLQPNARKKVAFAESNERFSGAATRRPGMPDEGLKSLVCIRRTGFVAVEMPSYQPPLRDHVLSQDDQTLDGSAMISQCRDALIELSNLSMPSIDELCSGGVHDSSYNTQDFTRSGDPHSENVADGHAVLHEETDPDETRDGIRDDTLKGEEISQAEATDKKQKGRRFQFRAAKKLKWMHSSSK